MRFKIRTTSNKTYLVDEDKIQTPTSFVKDAEALEENIDDVDEINEIDEKDEVIETKADKAKGEEELGSLDLTKKEVKLLKKLLDNADLLLALLDGGEKDQETDKDSKKSEKVDEDKQAEDSDFDFDEDGVGLEEKPEDFEQTKSAEEEVVETKDSCDVDDVKIQDSKRSFGSIERKASIADSDPVEDEIADAWAKYYGGR